MVHRWVATSILEASRGFRKLRGYAFRSSLSRFGDLNKPPALTTKDKLHEHQSDKTATSVINGGRDIPRGAGGCRLGPRATMA